MYVIIPVLGGSFKLVAALPKCSPGAIGSNSKHTFCAFEISGKEVISLIKSRNPGGSLIPSPGIILCMRPASERGRYSVTPSVINKHRMITPSRMFMKLTAHTIGKPSRQTRDAIITSSLRQDDNTKSFWLNYNVIFAPCFHWVDLRLFSITVTSRVSHNCWNRAAAAPGGQHGCCRKSLPTLRNPWIIPIN